ncbi:MAG: putative selenate ABC transporter substrate-binding protein [Candidatus Tectomicrobia bacterium]|nr:putative selenate ABC transporter substrate-binding protein [Candidatus Tectomicrobia bacterium]
MLVPAAGGSAEVKELRVSAIPDEAPTELLRKFQPLAAYLEAQLGMKVKFIPLLDYAATVEALAAKKVEMVWYGGFTHVQARRRTGNALALVQRLEDTAFHSKFIANADSGITSLGDLKGKTFTFGSVSSTSGHLMPRYYLLKQGVVPERDFGKFSYSGAHDATAKWVESGKVQAGVLNESVWQKLLEAGKVDPSKVKVIWTTPPYFDYNWTVRGDLDRLLQSKIVKAFLTLDEANPEQKKILDLQRTRGYVIATEDDYRGIEEAATAAGLLK